MENKVRKIWNADKNNHDIAVSDESKFDREALQNHKTPTHL